jgi:hypothetical protein
MNGNVELLAMILVDHEMVLVPGHVISNDTNARITNITPTGQCGYAA